MKILIADDHAVVREGLAALFERQPDLQVVGTADNGEKAVALAKELAPDLIIMDIAMPRLNGVSAIGQIVQCRPAVKIIVLSMHSENTIVTEARRSMLVAPFVGWVVTTSGATASSFLAVAKVVTTWAARGIPTRSMTPVVTTIS